MSKVTTGNRKFTRAASRFVAGLAGVGVAAGMLAASVPSEAAPAGEITAANLPWNADLEWQEQGDWLAQELWEGEGPNPTTKCLRGSVESSLGAEAVYQRDYKFSDIELPDRASAVIMEFDSNEEADGAYSRLADWATQCAGLLEDKGYTQLGDSQGHLISIPGTEARFTEISYREHGDDRDEAFFESIGAVRDGNKIALVSMNVWGMDNNWSYDSDEADSGLALHPMYRSMPDVADRLVS